MKLKQLLLIAAAICTGAACSQQEGTSAENLLAQDHYSFANSGQFVTEHLHLDLAVDFDTEVLHGTATLTMRREETGASEIVLDTRDLMIESVSFIDESVIAARGQAAVLYHDDLVLAGGWIAA